LCETPAPCRRFCGRLTPAPSPPEKNSTVTILARRKPHLSLPKMTRCLDQRPPRLQNVDSARHLPALQHFRQPVSGIFKCLLHVASILCIRNTDQGRIRAHSRRIEVVPEKPGNLFRLPRGIQNVRFLKVEVITAAIRARDQRSTPGRWLDQPFLSRSSAMRAETEVLLHRAIIEPPADEVQLGMIPLSNPQAGRKPLHERVHMA